MKKYYSGIVAILVAIICFGFTKPAKKENDWVVLVFTGNILNWWEVEDESLWIEDPNFDHYAECEGASGACAMEVDESSLAGVAPNRYLDQGSIQLYSFPGTYGSTYGYFAERNPLTSTGYIMHQWYKN